MKIKWLLAILFVLNVKLYAQDWTYRIGPDTLNNKSYYAYLWIPPSAKEGIMGLIMAPQISSEWQFVRNPDIRKAANNQKLAIIYFSPSRVSVLSAADTTYLLNTLSEFARVSGYQEIKYAPWLLFGHSTGCLFAMYSAYWKPERTFGVICYKGGIVPKPAWFNGSIEGIPVMGVQGEFEEYDNSQEVNATDHSSVALRNDVLNYRKVSPDKNLILATILPGEGHMLWTEQGIKIIAEFIEKAARYRLPQKDYACSGPVKLTSLNPVDGWAASGDPHKNISGVKIGRMKEFPEQDSCYWFFDKEFANHWLVMHQDVRKERQFVCPPSNPPVITPNPFRPLEFVPNGKIYETRILTDAAIRISGSSSSGLPVRVVYQTGPGSINKDTLRVNPAEIKDDMTIRVGLRQDGSEKYRIADRLIKVRISKREGKLQKVEFKPVTQRLKPGDKIDLHAVATSGLPVTLSLDAGPAVLNGNSLVVKPFTSKSGNALIIIRAGQEGNGEYATARPEELLIQVRKNHKN
jgi:hypothetical protein